MDFSLTADQTAIRDMVKGFAAEKIAAPKPAPAPSEVRVTTPAPPPRGLDPRYTFDKFVVGPTNQFAHAAARMVAEAPASKWNPLFIYGGVGLGKTHLLHAVGHEIHRQHPDWNITVITCERFVTDSLDPVGDPIDGLFVVVDR